MPTGVITFHRQALSRQAIPKWSKSNNGLSPLELTATHKIEDIDYTLQVTYFDRSIQLLSNRYLFHRSILQINIL